VQAILLIYPVKSKKLGLAFAYRAYSLAITALVDFCYRLSYPVQLRLCDTLPPCYGLSSTVFTASFKKALHFQQGWDTSRIHPSVFDPKIRKGFRIFISKIEMSKKAAPNKIRLLDRTLQNRCGWL